MNLSEIKLFRCLGNSFVSRFPLLTHKSNRGKGEPTTLLERANNAADHERLSQGINIEIALVLHQVTTMQEGDNNNACTRPDWGEGGLIKNK